MTRWNTEKARIQIAQDLTAIEDTYARLRAEAYHHAADKEIPGGTAMVLLGPRADIEAFTYVQASALEGRLRLARTDHANRIELQELDHDGAEPPLSFLAGWVDIIRETRAQPASTKRATIAREIDYLREALDWILATDQETGTPWWIPAEDFMTQLHNVRHTLEEVLREGERPDTGAPCLSDTCQGVRLVKQWAGTKTKPRPAAFDTWQCPRCRRRYTSDEYSNACRQASRHYADRLTATDMEETYRIHPSTLRTWAQRGHVRKRGKDDSGRMLYDVDDTLKARDLVQSETI